MTGLNLLHPEISLTGLALAITVADLFATDKWSRRLYHAAWISAAAIFLCVISTMGKTPPYGAAPMWSVDPFSQLIKLATLLTAVLCLFMGLDYPQLPKRHAGTFSSLLLLATAGLMFLASATDLLMVFVALELVSISSFVLTGFERGNPFSNEGSMKYFLFGAFSSAIMVYGISLYYGAAGSTRLIPALAASPLLILSLSLILLGFAFKASLAPMHFWVPDAYQGAPLPVTTYLSVAPKIATFAAMARIYSGIFQSSVYDLKPFLAIFAVLTMTIGNFTALFQSNAKRLLAYSSIAQAGYLMIGAAIGTPLGRQGILLYSLVYVAMNIGAFAVIQSVGVAKGSYELDAFDGLSKRRFGLALGMAFFLLSLAGIPPLAGFMGKLYIFSSAVQEGAWWLAVIGVVNSVVSTYYYFQIIKRMFLNVPSDDARIEVGPYVYATSLFAVAVVLFVGLFPEPLLSLTQTSSFFLP